MAKSDPREDLVRWLARIKKAIGVLEAAQGIVPGALPSPDAAPQSDRPVTSQHLDRLKTLVGEAERVLAKPSNAAACRRWHVEGQRQFVQIVTEIGLRKFDGPRH